jgi:hypothetical protein
MTAGGYLEARYYANTSNRFVILDMTTCPAIVWRNTSIDITGS